MPIQCAFRHDERCKLMNGKQCKRVNIICFNTAEYNKSYAIITLMHMYTHTNESRQLTKIELNS